MAFSTRVSSTTRDYLMPMLVDTVLNGNVFATRMLSSAKPWTFGEKLKQPIKYQKNSSGGSFSGFDSLSTNASTTRANMEFDPKFYHIDVALPLDELAVNATEQKMLDLASIELESSAQDAADDVGTMFWGNGTGNGGKDFLGLGAIIDDGSTVANIGGLSRSTYSTLASTVTASSGTISLAKIRTLFNAISSGAQMPTTAYTTKAVFGFYEQLLQPQERIAKDVSMMKKGLVGGTGFQGLFFQGIPVLSDEKCTSGVFAFVNENYIQWYGLNMPKTQAVKYKPQDLEGNDYPDSMTGLGFSWSDWIIPSNQAAVVGHVYLGGQLITSNPKRHGKLTGVTGV